MSATTASVDVNRPIDVVYNQWTQFESFPSSWRGRAHRPTRRHPFALGHQSRWNQPRIRCHRHRAASRGAGELGSPTVAPITPEW